MSVNTRRAPVRAQRRRLSLVFMIGAAGNVPVAASDGRKMLEYV